MTVEQLADYVESRLAPADVRRVETHLATGCPTCRADLAWLQDTLTLMAGDDWVSPPAHVRTAVQRAFRQQYQPATPASGLMAWLRGLLAQPAPLAMAFATALVLLVAGGLLMQTWRARPATEMAMLTSVAGEVGVQPADSAEHQSASAGRPIEPGDRVYTGEGSVAVLVYADRSATWLGSDAEVDITDLTVEPEVGRKVIVLHQGVGKTYHRVQPLEGPESRYEVRTPAAVISVRGTEFEVEVGPTGTTTVAVAKGRVAVTAQGETVEVQAAQQVTVIPGQPPASPVPAPTPVPPPGLPAISQPGQPLAPEEPTLTLTVVPAMETTSASGPGATPAPSRTPKPTATRVPTDTREATKTREPSRTPEPTRTERPTRTPEP
ncbi:MAG: hypothetical protein D6791_18970, partial [Chloroflexi bacterium]